MSALGQKQTLRTVWPMSALHPKADMTARHCSGLNQQLSEHQKGQKARHSQSYPFVSAASQVRTGKGVKTCSRTAATKITAT
jgi:hypothetical protein